MTGARSALSLLVVATVALGACRSDSDGSVPVTTPGSGPIVTPTTGTVETVSSDDGSAGSDSSGSESTGSDGVGSADATTDAPSDSSESDSSEPDSSESPPSTLVVTLPPDADELVLSDGFSNDGDDADDADGWGSETWEVDAPGEAVVTAVDGIGVMTTDARGTHEWVRAIASGSTHEDARLDARITPIRSNEGTVFIGMHGDGEWRDNTSYLPQSGVVLEYSYSEVFLGEIVLILLDGPDEQRIGPVQGPILADGESADIRFEVFGGEARVKVWRTGTDEPSGWSIVVPIPADDVGLVQLAYRDGVDQSVSWDELTLRLWL